MSLPTSQSIQYYTTRDGTTVAIAQKTPASAAGAPSAAETVNVPVSIASSGGQTFHVNADTLQLMGMANALPSSNLFVNYPHTMWERDSEGNRIPVQNVTVGTSQTTVVKAEGDALSQATAVIKSEVAGVPKTSPGSSISKGFVCEICSKGFAKREHLTKHIRYDFPFNSSNTKFVLSGSIRTQSATLATFVRSSSVTGMSWCATRGGTLVISPSAAMTVARVSCGTNAT